MNDQDFWQNVQYDPQSGCMNWTGATNPRDGYGQVRRGDKVERAHIVSYEMVNGKVPAGAVLEHLCDNRTCINPQHLTPQTQQHNLTDMAQKGRGTPVGASGTRGVRQTDTGWEARIKTGGQLKHIGTFSTENEAAAAYQQAAAQRAQ